MSSQNSLEVNLSKAIANGEISSFTNQGDAKTPFNVYIIPELLEQDNFNRLREDVKSSVKLKPKDNDLYKFKQSKDIKSEVASKKLSSLLHDFIDVMLGPVRQHFEKTTGLKLSSKYFDITISRYDQGNYLLCHNDDIKDVSKQHGRALAFIYYLNSRVWTTKDGGSLLLYESDSLGEPVAISNSISPRPNTLVAFHTSPTSWHSVQEVLCQDDCRLSINGWFHTETNLDKINLPQIEAPKAIEPCPFLFVRPIVVDQRLEKIFLECFNQQYLMEKTCMMIRKKFKRKSEINLTNFLVKEKFQEISLALKEASQQKENLTHVGPFNKRNYHKFHLDQLPQICRDIYDAFRSELFFMLLSRLTGLDLQPPSLKAGQAKSNDEENNDDHDEDDDDDDEDEEEDSDLSDETDSDEEEDDDEDDDDDDDDDEGDQCNDDNNRVGVSNSANSGQSGSTTSKSHSESGCASKKGDKSSVINSKEKLVEKLNELKSSPRKRRRTSDPIARLEYRHLDSGSYTIIHDHGFELGEKSALDVILHFNHDFAVNFDHGGYISYIDGAEDDLHDMDCELLTVEPKSNCLSMVYRCDEGTCRFLKYITGSHKSGYQDLHCVFYEKSDDLPVDRKNLPLENSN